MMVYPVAAVEVHRPFPELAAVRQGQAPPSPAVLDHPGQEWRRSVEPVLPVPDRRHSQEGAWEAAWE